ncbi:MAG: FAD-dependent oxidoreductase [Pseudomonadota bacterium]
MSVSKFDICVIGGGSAGLSVAAGAAQLGQKVVLFEEGEMGGDCLNYGCVPSKALLAASKRAHAFRTSAPFGIAPAEPQVDFGAVRAHVRSVIDTIAPIDSQERFEGLGVRVVRAHAMFTDARTVEAAGERFTARLFVIATGSKPATPPIPGLADTPYVTNETIFDLDEAPGRLLIIGAGPIGMEMAQAHRRLGSEVTVIDANRPLSKDDPELSEIVVQQLRADGVEILQNARAVSVTTNDAGGESEIELSVDVDGARRVLTGRKLLVAVGRRPTVDGLGLEAAGVAYSPSGIEVDAKLRTTNKRVYALGDVSGGRQFTHVAGYHASVFVRNALFKTPAKNEEHLAPWVTYTDPELAHVGLTEADARERHGDGVLITRWPLEENDRAQAERDTRGLIKLVTKKNGDLLGASIVGAGAGDLIQPWVLAVSSKLKLTALTDHIAAYPTRGEISKRAASAYYSPKVFSKPARALVRVLSWLG